MTRIAIPGVITISGGAIAVIVLFAMWIGSNSGTPAPQPQPITPSATQSAATPTPIIIQQDAPSSAPWFFVGLLLGVLIGLIAGLTGAYIFWRSHGKVEP